MKSNLSKWVNIAEIASGIAVVISLVFLIVGIRENTDITRFAVYTGLIDTIIENERNRMNNPELLLVWQAYVNEETAQLTEKEKSMVFPQAAIVFRSYEKAYFARQYNVIGDEEWGRFERLICIHDAYANSASVNLDLEQILTAGFTDYIVTACRK